MPPFVHLRAVRVVRVRRGESEAEWLTRDPTRAPGVRRVKTKPGTAKPCPGVVLYFRSPSLPMIAT